jgi:hypothetical protein
MPRSKALTPHLQIQVLSTGQTKHNKQQHLDFRGGSKEASARGRTRVSVNRKSPRRLWWARDSKGKGGTTSPPACAGGAKTCTRWHTAILCGVSSRSALPVPPPDAASAAPPPTPANKLMAPPAAAGDEGFEFFLFFRVSSRLGMK